MAMYDITKAIPASKGFQVEIRTGKTRIFTVAAFFRTFSFFDAQNYMCMQFETRLY